MAEPLVIVAAVNGGMQLSRDGAHVPISPEEIAEDARLCREAGAAVVHVHARDEDGHNTADPAVYAEIIRLTRERTDILIQTTNGVGVSRDPATGRLSWPSDEQRLALMRLEPKPDLYGIAAGSTDFYHPDGGYHDETPYINSPDYLKETIRAVYEQGSSLEFEVTDVHALHRLAHYANEGLFDREAPYVWLLHGTGLCFIPNAPEHLIYQVGAGSRLFPNAVWSVVGAGRANFTTVAHGIAMGAKLTRIGFEDSLYLPNGEIAERNHHLVEELVRIAGIFGRRPASPAEARTIVGLDRAASRSTVTAQA